MDRSSYLLGIDQGTSSTKSLIFGIDGNAVAKGIDPLHTSFLSNGFVEQAPEDIYRSVLQSVKACLEEFTGKGLSADEIAAIGISNQRETFLLWDRSGQPLCPAIVWQCKRSVQICDELSKGGLATMVREKTGLVIDPYFSATKLIWLLRHDPHVKDAVHSGNAFFGTIDTWLLYKLTKGAVYATDHTNASRTLFFNIHSLAWDQELISAFGLSGIHLPELKPSAALYGETDLGGLLPKPLPVTALAGDSHAAAFGEGCYDAGTAKATLGTGCSILMNIGNKPLPSANGMVTTICWSIEGRVDYALEGIIVSCGATLEWLKNELGLFTDSKETAAMAAAVSDNGGVYLVPSFSGLGSPHWQMERKASISGMSFGTTKKHIVRAALESIPYQVKDVITAMEKDASLPLRELMTNGGITSNSFVMQLLADLLGKNVASTAMPDVSALGAALLAGLGAGIYKNMDALRAPRDHKQGYRPINPVEALKAYKGWQEVIVGSL
jgi:glycerol kinase